MKIAIIRLSALGDTIQTAIVLQFIKKHITNAQITWVCDEKFSEILSALPELSRVISIPLKEKNFLRSWKILREFHGEFDLILDFQGLIKSALVARILGTNVIGFNAKGTKESLATKFYAQKISCDYGENVILRYLTLASCALGFKFDESEILERKNCFKAQILNTNLDLSPNSILIAPFSSDKSKNYTHFDAVICALKNSGHEVYLCYGSKSEFIEASNLAKATNAKILPNFSASQMVAIIEKFALIIGNDSAIVHLAWAQNRPCIALFGNRPSDRNFYSTKTNLAINAGKKIDPRKIDKSDFCINLISPNLIVDRANRLLHG